MTTENEIKISLGSGRGGFSTINISNARPCVETQSCPYRNCCQRYNGQRILTIERITRSTVSEVKRTALCVNN